MRWQQFEGLRLMVPWALPLLVLSLCCRGLVAAAAAGPVPDQHAASSSPGQAPLDWLLTDRGPFHRAQEYTDFAERYRQGFTTRYRIYREFARWKVNNLALERKDFFSLPLPLAPEFIRNIRLLGRRPSLQQITENLIKKYGTHFLLSATLGGLQVLLPDYLRECFVAAALSYITCSSEGELICRKNDCWCQCGPGFPDCNCPEADIQAMEDSLLQIQDAWDNHNRQFEESEELQSLVKRLPEDRFVNMTTVSQYWAMDLDVQHRYQQLGTSLKLLLKKTHRIIRRLFNLCKRCHRQPRFRLPKERSLPYWWNRIQSFLYCSETTPLGTFLEDSHSCTCPSDQVSCQGSIPCALGDGPACAACAEENSTRCGTCNPGYVLSQGLCRPEVAESLEHYLGLETDLQDLELKYLLQKRDSRIEVHSIFISNDMRLGSWFDPSWRKRMLLTLKSNKYKPGLVHIMLALSLQICLTKNSTLEPVMAVYVNPFGGSHSESWFMPVKEGGFPDWERTSVDASALCQNWTLTLGNKWKTFFETVHVYLRSRIKSLDDSSNETIYYEPLEMVDPSKNLGYMKINSLQVFGFSMPFDPDAIRDLILQLDYPYTQGSQDSALLQLIEIRDRVNRLSPPGKTRLDLFSCLLRHRLKLANNEVGRIQSSMQAFSAKLPSPMEYETGKLCS
ncbi:BMP/retinoic acid-inducible neural-specific protein 2 isoform X3 [Chrysemys picta bellii]|uniref:BMP/retinoic acid-inducible neural-specific protein 2 isoform X3 n=1 Tax=Chrysemys picta bellii TaxID=8478 RepID=UPI001C670A41|nr:BMP/retinoic acid-inducible neural-specific protein 2 isoform X3 [Chrysemys picta bellii]